MAWVQATPVGECVSNGEEDTSVGEMFSIGRNEKHRREGVYLYRTANIVLLAFVLEIKR